MPEASDNGSQPYRNAVRCFEMAGKDESHTQNLATGKGHTQLMSPTQGQADIIEATLAPAISQPLWGQLYGWLPLSNAYRHSFWCDTTYIKHLTVFHSIATQHKSNGLTAFPHVV